MTALSYLLLHVWLGARRTLFFVFPRVQRLDSPINFTENGGNRKRAFFGKGCIKSERQTDQHLDHCLLCGVCADGVSASGISPSRESHRSQLFAETQEARQHWRFQKCAQWHVPWEGWWRWNLYSLTCHLFLGLSTGDGIWIVKTSLGT